MHTGRAHTMSSLLLFIAAVASAGATPVQRREGTPPTGAPACASSVKAESRFEASLAAPFEVPATAAEWKARQPGTVEEAAGRDNVTETTFKCTDDTGDFVESATFRPDGSKYFVARLYPRSQQKIPDPVLTWLLGNNHRVQVTGADRLEISLGSREGATETLTIRISSGSVYLREKTRAYFPR